MRTRGLSVWRRGPRLPAQRQRADALELGLASRHELAHRAAVGAVAEASETARALAEVPSVRVEGE